MPDLSSNLSTIRDSRYWYRAYVSTPVEAEVLRGTISATPAEPTLSVAYTNVSGSHSNVLQDMECEFFRSSVSLGRARVAPGGATSSVLQIEEVSAGRLKLQTGDQLRVYRSWRTRTRLVGATSDVLRDSRIAIGTNLSSYRPVANSGGGYAGFVSGGVVTVILSAFFSYTVDPDSSGTLTYSWAVQDGTIISGVSSDMTITATFPAGFRWISLTVTDNSNSQTSTQYIPIWAHERTGANAPQEVLITSMTGERGNGWECSLQALDSATQTSLSDGALVYIWNEEYYNATEVSYGAASAGRSHIKFVGYLQEDTSENNPESSERQSRVEFRALSPLLRLQQLAGFSQAVERTASSTSWLEATGLTTKVMMDYIVRFGSTLQVCHDFITAGAPDYDYPAFYLQAATPYTQLLELVDSVDAVLTCDRIGRVLVYPDQFIRADGERGSITTTLTLTEADVLTISGRRQHWYRYAQLEGRATLESDVVSGVQPLFSRAPGLAPADAPQFTERDRLIVSSQSNLNERTGMRFARENSLYDGLPTYESVEVTLRGGYDVFDFHNEWIKLNIPTLYDARGVGWGANNQRYVILSIAVDYLADTGAKEVRLTLQAETTGEAGATYIQPPDPQSQLDITPIFEDFPQLEELIPIPDVQVIDNDLPLRIYAIGGAANEISRMVSFNYADGTGTVEDMDASNVTTGLPLWAFGDPFFPARFYVLTTDGLWKTDDRAAASPSWAMIADNLDITGNASHIAPYGEMSINRQGYIAVMSGNALCTTFDYGATWEQHSVEGTLTTSSDRLQEFGFAVSPYNNPNASGQGWVYAAPKRTDKRVLRINTNWGRGSWTDLVNDTVTFNLEGQVIVPYTRTGGVANKNDNNQQIIAAYMNSGGRQTGIAVRKGGAVDWTHTWGSFYSPPVTGISPVDSWSHRAMNSFTSDGRYLRILGNNSYIYESALNGADFDDPTGLNWTTVATPHGARAGGGNINGWGNDRRFMLCFGSQNGGFSFPFGTLNGWLNYTPDGGTTWYDLKTAFGFTDYRCQYAELASV